MWKALGVHSQCFVGSNANGLVDFSPVNKRISVNNGPDDIPVYCLFLYRVGAACNLRKTGDRNNNRCVIYYTFLKTFFIPRPTFSSENLKYSCGPMTSCVASLCLVAFDNRQ